MKEKLSQTFSEIQKKHGKNFVGRLPLNTIFTQQDVGKYFIAPHWNLAYDMEDYWLKLWRVTAMTEIRDRGFFRQGIVSYRPEELEVEIVDKKGKEVRK